MKLKSLHHIAVICSDYERSKRFYTGVLGFRVAAEHYRADRRSYKTDLVLDGVCTVELFSFPDPPTRLSYPEAAGLRHIAFAVDDVAAAAADLEAAGIGHEPVRVDEYTGRRFFFFSDPDNLPIEIYEA